MARIGLNESPEAHLPEERPLTAEEHTQLESDLAAFDEVAAQIGATWQIVAREPL